MEKQYYTVQECADIYGVSEKTVRNWIKEQIIDACRPGGRIIRIDVRSCDNLSAPIRYVAESAKKRMRREGPLHTTPKLSPGKTKAFKTANLVSYQEIDAVPDGSISATEDLGVPKNA